MSVDTIRQGMPQHLCDRAITSTAWNEPDKTGPDDQSRDWDNWSAMQRRVKKMIELRAAKEATRHMKWSNRRKKTKFNPNLIIVLKACAT